LAWTDASNNETSFQVQTSTDGGTTWGNLGAAIIRTPAQSTATGAPALTSTVTVSNTTNALYQVLAINVTGSTASVGVSLNDTVAPVAPTINSAPTQNLFNISARVTLNWTDTANNNASYTVARCSNTVANANCTNVSSVWTNLTTTLAGNIATWTNALQPRLTSFTYRVMAVNSAGSASATSSVVTP
jgi:hypothetical protein